jgi:hypothetical protein
MAVQWPAGMFLIIDSNSQKNPALSFTCNNPYQTGFTCITGLSAQDCQQENLNKRKNLTFRGKFGLIILLTKSFFIFG